MSPHNIITALEKHGDMSNITSTGSNEYQGIRKDKPITVKIKKHRGAWQLVATDGARSVPSNTFPWQEAIFSDLHWFEFD